MENIDYGEITKLSSRYITSVRNGDYGTDKYNNIFTYTPHGWEPINKSAYEAFYWKKKYEELKNK